MYRVYCLNGLKKVSFMGFVKDYERAVKLAAEYQKVTGKHYLVEGV